MEHDQIVVLSSPKALVRAESKSDDEMVDAQSEDANEELPEDMLKVCRDVEAHMKALRQVMEDKMMRLFGYARLEQTRKYTYLINRINKTRDDFIENLRVLGSAE